MMNAWITSFLMGLVFYGIGVVDSSLMFAVIGSLVAWSIVNSNNSTNEIIDELDRIRKTQLVQVYDGGDIDEID
tara:strand:+ start:270 stop:491 length:222 start_codon:yes stop_codon:yes gene_type:complete